MALGILASFDLAALPPDSVASQHLQIEAMKLAFADVHRYVGDPRDDEASGRRRCSTPPTSRRARARSIPRGRRTSAPARRRGAAPSTSAPPTRGGMMVSLIQSNYMGFGSGVVVPGTGISLQNRGAGFSLAPGHPNEIGGGKRPFHTIIPGFLTRDGAPLAAFGVMGGPIQPPGHVQTLVRLLDLRDEPAGRARRAALEARRRARRSISSRRPATSCARGLAALGHEIAAIADPYMDFGAGQFIVRNRRRAATSRRPIRAATARRRASDRYEPLCAFSVDSGSSSGSSMRRRPASGAAERRRRAHRRERAPREVLVALRALDLPRHLLLGQRAQHLGRDAGGERARRDDHAGLDEGHRRDDRRLADHRVVVDHGVHADQRIALDDAAVQHRPVADVPVLLDDRVGARDTRAARRCPGCWRRRGSRAARSRRAGSPAARCSSRGRRSRRRSAPPSGARTRSGRPPA